MKKRNKILNLIMILTLILCTACGGGSDDVIDTLSNPVIASISGNLNSSLPSSAPLKTINKGVAVSAVSNSTVELILGGKNLGSVTTDTDGFFRFQITALDLVNETLLTAIENGDLTSLTNTNAENLLLQFKANINSEEYNFFLPPTILTKDAEAVLGDVEISTDPSDATKAVIKLGSALTGGETSISAFKTADIPTDFSTLVTSLKTAEDTLKAIVSETEIIEDNTTKTYPTLSFIDEGLSTLTVYNLIQESTSSGSYTVIKFDTQNNTKTDYAGTYTMTSQINGGDETVITVSFTETEGTAPSDVMFSATEKTYGYLREYTDLNTSNMEWFVCEKINGAYTLKFAETGTDYRSIVDFKNKMIYNWEEPEGQDEVYSSDSVTIEEITGGYKVSDGTNYTSYIYNTPGAWFIHGVDDGDICGNIVTHDIKANTYEFEGFTFEKSKSFTDNNIFKNTVYCAYFKDPRSITVSPTWDELHIMDISASSIVDKQYDIDEANADVEEVNMTYNKIDDTLLQITAGATTINGILVSKDDTKGIYNFQMTPSDTTFYETVALTTEDISGNTFTIIIKTEDNSTISQTVGNITFGADNNISGAGLTGTWSISSGSLIINNETEAMTTEIIKLKMPLSNSVSGFNFFVLNRPNDSTQTADIERGEAVLQP